MQDINNAGTTTVDQDEGFSDAQEQLNTGVIQGRIDRLVVGVNAMEDDIRHC
ncbi:hypothetical protein Cyrtocomes_00757 [Candidatus Cyrtobacter comes]|uniref:Uncharacterized protein n=1 Tax=Candidatus Cyrtobacter comes TaxID=675776 RepID=A0ABU5L8D5_9RICK|nr:hypothetical protein [Candidatus Cyrtobacter comes]MDZ5762378.1 hypothetical protein [Candidatus Cyrtobacter comes]